MNLISKLTAPIATAITVAFSSGILAFVDLPAYGLWTGIRPLEDKIKKLKDFASRGPVDAIVFGSSIADFGFSAERYSKLMSEELGQPYRVFNFSTGGAELSTIPALYRIARTVVKPKAIFLTIPVQFKRSEELFKNSPDYILANAPVGSDLGDPLRLELSAFYWTLPLIEKSAALRDLVMYGRYKNLIGAGMDTYHVTEYGDRISFTAGQASLEHMQRLRQAYEEQVKPLPEGASQVAPVAKNAYFPLIDVKAMEELRNFSQQDNFKIYVMAHSSAAPLWVKPTENTEYKIGRMQYFNTLTMSVSGILIDPLNNFSVPDFAVMEDTHMNAYGAEMYTRAAFKKAVSKDILNQYQLNEEINLAVPLRSMESTFNGWSSIVIREKGVRIKFLRIKFVENFAVPKIPKNDIYFALRMRDGSDIMAQAKKMDDGYFQAEININETNKSEALIVRLVYGVNSKTPLNAPIAKYYWAS